MTHDFEQELKQELEFRLDDATPPNLANSIRYSLLSPGKRIRPRLVFATSEMLGLPRELALPPAIAIEMIHCFTLIHDDLPCMDNDDFRRGLPTNHKKFGEAVALLAGDALIPVAIETLLGLEGRVPAPRLQSALKRLLWASGPRGVAGGQAAESLLDRPGAGLADLETMFAMKTGALFSAAILMPKDLIGIDDQTEQGKSIEAFARELGHAFQVADDLEDAPKAETPRESHAPTSILRYVSRQEAIAATSKRLAEATHPLRRHWGESAAAMVAISEEVSRKLVNA